MSCDTTSNYLRKLDCSQKDMDKETINLHMSLAIQGLSSSASHSLETKSLLKVRTSHMMRYLVK